MNAYWHYADGKIFQAGTGVTDEALHALPEGVFALVADQLVDNISDYYIADGRVVTKPARPSPVYEFDYDTKAWFDPRSLAKQQSDQWDRIKTSRNAALTAPLTTVYGVFDADDGSQKNITDAVSMLQTMATAGYPQTVEYTLYDNTVATLSTAQMVEVGLALGRRTQQIYATARSLRSAIDAAATISEIEAIVWPA